MKRGIKRVYLIACFIFFIFLLILIGNINYYNKENSQAITGKAVSVSASSEDALVAEQIAQNEFTSNVDVTSSVNVDVDTDFSDNTKIITFNAPDSKIQMNFDLLNYSDWQEKRNQEALDAENFDVSMQESPEKYKWGYDVKLKSLDFMAKVDVFSNETIYLVDNNTIRIGNSYISFNDLAKQGYVVSIGEPVSLNINFSEVLFEVFNMTNETEIVNITEGNFTLNDTLTNASLSNITGNGTLGNVTLPAENQTQSNQTSNQTLPAEEIPAENETSPSEEIPAENESLPSEETPAENESSSGIEVGALEQSAEEATPAEPTTSETGVSENIITEVSGFVALGLIRGISGFIVHGIEGINGMVIDNSLENKVSVYIEKDFTNETSVNVGDTINLDPEYYYQIGEGGSATNGTIIYQCGEVNTSGVYDINQSITSMETCLNITADSVSINGNGFSITHGTGSDKYGILINGVRNNITIKNCILSYDTNRDSIRISNNLSNSLFMNNTLSGTNGYGIRAVYNVTNTLFTGNSISTGGIPIYIEGMANDCNFSGNSISTSGSVKLEIMLPSNNVNFIEQNINGFQIVDYSNVSFENTTYGKITLSNMSTGASTLSSSNIVLANNSAYVDSSAVSGRLNVSGTITLYNVPNYTSPIIVRDGAYTCNGNTDPKCFNISSLNNANVTFNVSSWSNYSIASSLTLGNILDCVTINSPGNYILTQNISSSGDCLIINSSNLAIDCSGYTINSNTGAAINISSGNWNNINVRNCNINAPMAGIILPYYSSNLGFISNSSFINNTINTSVFGSGGIYIYSYNPFSMLNSSNISILNNSITVTGACQGTEPGSDTSAVFLLYINNSIIENNTLSSACRKIDLPGVQNSIIKNNIFSSTGTDLYVSIGYSGVNNLSIIDNNISSYNIGASSNISFENSSVGKISLNNIFASGTNLFSQNGSNADIKIWKDSDITAPINSYAYVNPAASSGGLNKSGVITFYNLATNYTNPKILRNGFICSSSICTNLTSLNAGNVTFNVTGWSNYTISQNGVILNGSFDSCGLIYSSGTYNLTANISSNGTCLEINASNVVINGNNYTITGDRVTSNSYGIYAYGNIINLSIANLSVINYSGSGSAGILASYVNSSIVNYTNIISSSYGIYLNNSNNNSFSNFTISSTSLAGVYMLSSSNNTFTIGNISSSSSDLLQLKASSGNVFNNITLEVNPSYYALNISNNSNSLNPSNSFKNMSISTYILLNNINNITLILENQFGKIDFSYNGSGSYGGIYGNGSYLFAFSSANSSNNADIMIENNSVYVNSSKTGLAQLANISLYNLNFSQGNLKIVRNNQYQCTLNTNPSCNNFTSLSGGNITTFYVSNAGGNYSIGSLNIYYIDACDNLDVPGTYYLISNISASGNCINITSNNVTLDCQSYWISTTTGIPVYINNNNTIIQNCNITTSSINSVHVIKLNMTVILNNITIKNSNISSSSTENPNYLILSNQTENFIIENNSISGSSNSYGISGNFINSIIANNNISTATSLNFTGGSNLLVLRNNLISGSYDLNIGGNITNLSLVDQTVTKLYIGANNYVNFTIENTSFGKIKFLQQVGDVGNIDINLSDYVQINNLSVFVNSNMSYFNKNANITLYNVPEMINPRMIKIINSSIKMNGSYLCLDCYNFTLLNGNVTFNVSNNISFFNNNLTNFTISPINNFYIDSCGTLRYSANYTLGTNLSSNSSNCLVIGNDNILLNGNGYSINQTGEGPYYGISSSGNMMLEVENITIKNFIDISRYDYGIYIYQWNSTIIDNVTISNSTYGVYSSSGPINYLSVSNSTLMSNTYGIYFMSPSTYNYINITNNTINSTTGVYGIYFGKVGAGNQITSNNISSGGANGDGIYLSTGSGAIINNNNVHNNARYGIYLNDVNNSVLNNNNASSNSYSGIYLLNSNNNALNNNTVNSNSLSGIYLSSSNNNNITNNTINNNLGPSYAGIYVNAGCANNLITSNNLTNNYYGVYSSGTGTVIENGAIVNSTSANIYLFSGSANITSVNLSSNTSTNDIYTSAGGPYWIKDTFVGNYSLNTPIIIENSTYGKIAFSSLLLSGINLYGNSSCDIIIGNNSAFVNSTSGSNLYMYSANVTLYNLPTNYVWPGIFRNDTTVCWYGSSPSCSNLTSLNAGNVTFNVSSWSNYSVGEVPDVIPPVVTILYPLNITYSINVSNINYSLEDERDSGYCWMSNSSGVWNSTAIVNRNNFTNVISKDGWNNWSVYCNDSTGNLGIANARFYQNSINPGVALNLPVNGTYTLNRTQWYSANLSDNTALGNATIYLWNSTGILVNSSNVSITGTANTTNVSLSVNYDGLFRWNCQVCDDGGNCVFNSTNNTIIIDRTVPLIDYGARTQADSTRFRYNFIYVNLSVSEQNFKNVTFRLYYSNNTIVNTTSYNTTTYNSTRGYAVNWTGLAGGDYKYNVTMYDMVNQTNSTATRSITLVTNEQNISLNAGWNLVSLTMKTNSTSDKNISLNAGWNLIGYSANNSYTLDNATFTIGNGSSGGLGIQSDGKQITSMSVPTAVQQGLIKPYFAYYDSSSASPQARKYKYTATSSLNMDDTALRVSRGYWVYANQSGTLTLRNVSGTNVSQTYAWSSLRFSNGTAEMNITDAATAGWIESTLQYYEEDQLKTIESAPDEGLGKNNISSWEGVFVKSKKDNITMHRQN